MLLKFIFPTHESNCRQMESPKSPELWPTPPTATVSCSWRKCHSGWSCLSLSLLCSGWFSLSSLALLFHVNVQLWDKSLCRIGQQVNITRTTPKQANSTGDHAQTGKHHQGTCPNRTDPLLPPFPSPCHLALTAIQKLPSEHLDIAVASTLATQ